MGLRLGVAKDDLPPLFAPGQRLGRYELVRRLAVGGMAEVYLATATGPGDFRKVVAIKRLLPQHALDPQLLRMFLDEARLMARLSHPNVPQVTDVDDGTGGDVPYFVMEYIHGTDLRGVLNAAGGPLPIEHALAITEAVAAGLHHAHEQRGADGQPLEIVHRDVSPSNILISFDGGVKVTDFGVAKWTEQRSFTHQGQLKGKFAHMSPEQCRGEALDRRSDVFALGTLLYEMTTGQPPFVAASEYELLSQIVSSSAPAPRRQGEQYPPHLASIVMRSLGRTREERTPTTQHMQLELEAFAREHKLVVSSVALAEYLESLFGARVTQWRQALKSGQNLIDHLHPRAARPGRPDEASDDTAQRTVTDAFAVGPGTSTRARAPDEHQRPMKASATPATQGAGDGAPRARARASVARTLTMTGVATLAFAALWVVATQLASRWSQSAVSIVTPVPRVEPVSPAPARSDPSPPSRPPRFSQPVRTGGIPESIATSTMMTRRGRDTTSTARPTRRGPTAQSAPVAADGAPYAAGRDSLVETLSPGAPLPGYTAVSPQTIVHPSPPTSAIPTTEPRTGAPAPAPVKVWDPDSPVPP
jgi:serine/threonine protein kinase